MSRIGKLPVEIPAGVTITVGDKEIEKSTPDTIEEANKVIAAYYGYLANSDADGLRNIGQDYGRR